MKKAIRYHRFSKKGQSQNSIERQDNITGYWSTHQKIHIVDTFNDEGYSARNFDRPDVKALFAFIKRNYRNIDYLIVAELTRFSREAGDAINMVKEIQEKYGIRIVSAQRGMIYDVYDSNSFFLMGLEFLLGNSENIKRQNDINGGIYTAKAEGRWIQGGPAPFGFVKEGIEKERHLVVKESEAAVVRFIYSAFLKNTPFYIILQDARAMGFKRTSNNAIQDVLQNPLYMGFQEVKPWKEYPGGLFPLKDHSPIIDQATWYKVQEKFKDRSKPRISIGKDFELRGLLKCHCQKHLTGAPSRSKSGKYINYYNCKVPGHNTINANHAHDTLNEVLKLMSLPKRLINAIKNRSAQEFDQRMKETKLILQTKEQDLQKINIKLKSIEEKFILNQLNFDSYSTWHRTLTTERQQLGASIEKLNRDGNQVEMILQGNLDRLGDLHGIYNLISIPHKQELLRQVFDNGLYYRERAYRTPYVMPVFTHNLLTLKQKSLLFVDGWNEYSGEVEATGLLSNTLLDFLSFLDSLKAA